MNKELTVRVGTPAQTLAAFADAWKKASKGEAGPPVEVLTFESLEGLLSVLTPGRWTLLRVLHENGPLSVRKLSRILDRDYKNVHTDVAVLESVGIITRTVDRLVEVPWKTITAHMSFAA